MRSPVHDGPLKGLRTGTTSFKALLCAGVLLLGTVVVAPFFLSRAGRAQDGQRVWRLITTHDLPNFVPMMEQFDKVLRSGVLYPRWDPDFNMGYGTATANFYPPVTFYATSMINAVVNNWVITLFILSALSLAASSLAFYALARTFFSRPASAAAALFYTLLPYHQLDLYWRGAIPEFVGFAFLPMILYFAFKLGSEGRLRYYAAVGLCHGVYLMSHLPVGYLFTYVLAFYAVIWAVRERDVRIASRIAGGMALSLLVSAIYWLPAALEGRYIYEWASEIFPYHDNYISMTPVFDAFLRHIQEVFNNNALALIATILILLKLRKSPVSHSATTAPASQDRSAHLLESQTAIWMILGIATPFMSTSFSIQFSKLIPKIQMAVPPFRWLAISCLFTSLLVAASIDGLRKQQGLRPNRELVYRVALGAVFALNLWLTAHGIILDALSKPTYSPSASFVDAGFTPKDSTRPSKMIDTAAVVITPEGGASEVLKWLPTHREIAVRVDQPSEVRIKTYNFPGWTARIDGKVVPMLSDKDGVQQVEVPVGVHNLQASFENTPPRTAGALVSAVGLLIILGLTFAGRSRERGLEGERTDEEPAAKKTIDHDQSRAPSVSTTKLSAAPQLKRFGAIGLVLLVSIAIIVMSIRRSDSRPENGGGAGTRRSAGSDQPMAGSVGAGSDAQLYLAGKDSVMVATDEKTAAEILAALASKDETALEALTGSGRALKVNNTTRVRVIQTIAGQTKVRILEGPYVMMEVWAPERWLR